MSGGFEECLTLTQTIGTKSLDSPFSDNKTVYNYDHLVVGITQDWSSEINNNALGETMITLVTYYIDQIISTGDVSFWSASTLANFVEESDENYNAWIVYLHDFLTSPDSNDGITLSGYLTTSAYGFAGTQIPVSATIDINVGLDFTSYYTQVNGVSAEIGNIDF